MTQQQSDPQPQPIALPFLTAQQLAQNQLESNPAADPAMIKFWESLENAGPGPRRKHQQQ
jgi:hypothetical protein